MYECLPTCVYIMCACLILSEARRELDLMELQVVMSCYVGAGDLLYFEVTGNCPASVLGTELWPFNVNP